MELSSQDLPVLRDLEQRFPLLKKGSYKVTSPRTKKYNCIAWASCDSEKWWWPNGPYYWPAQIPRSTSSSAFLMAYELQGYSPCESRNLEKGYEKVALFAGSDGQITHAARQLTDGSWTSKLGAEFDISHSLESIEGVTYGFVLKILRRAIPKPIGQIA